MVTKQSGALFLIDTSLADEGKYSCMAGDQIIAEVELKVYDVPSRISKILVSSNSVYSTGMFKINYGTFILLLKSVLDFSYRWRIPNPGLHLPT